MRPLPSLALAATLALSLPGTLIASTPATLRVSVSEGKGEAVDISVPLSLAGSLANAVPAISSGTSIQVGDRDVSVADLRALWADVQRSGSSELLSVKDGSDEVRISTRGGRVLVRVAESGKQTVQVDIPHGVVDALLKGDGPQLDVSAAIAELQKMKAGEIVRIDDGASRVRISIE